MLPSLTSRAERYPRRVLLSLGAALLLAGALLGARESPPREAVVPPSLATRLAPSTWAITVPMAWLAAPPAGLRSGDRVDILALRPGERATATAVAFDLEVMSSDDRVIVLGAAAADVTAVAVARASGQLIVPLVRSTR